jgi:transposase
MAKKYIVELTLEEREHLLELISKNKTSRAKIVNAYILLKADIEKDGKSWNDRKISESFNVSIKKVERTRKLLVKEGLEAALNRKTASNYKPRKLQGDEEAYLVATCCSQPPEGKARWTLQMLGDKLVEMNYVESISLETVRQGLKKMNLNLGERKDGVSHQ